MTQQFKMPNAEQATKLLTSLQKYADEYYLTPDGIKLKEHLALFESWIKAKIKK